MESKIGLVQPETTNLGAEELGAVEKLQQSYHNMKSELGKVIVGQEAVIEELLISLFCKGQALLEAMQEHQVTAGGKMHRLPQPFFVLATQNPIEQEGTYPLPEAQLDRFMFNINVGYPSEEEEFQIVRLTTQSRTINLQHVLSGEEVLALQEIVRKVPVADHVIRYALQFSRLTRRTEGGCPDFVNEYVGWGAGPRASQYLILAGKARALLKGRYHVSTEDIRQVALPVLRHRIVTNFNAEAEGIKSDTIVKKLMEFIPRQQYDEQDASAAKLMRGQSVA